MDERPGLSDGTPTVLRMDDDPTPCPVCVLLAVDDTDPVPCPHRLRDREDALALLAARSGAPLHVRVARARAAPFA